MVIPFHPLRIFHWENPTVLQTHFLCWIAEGVMVVLENRTDVFARIDRFRVRLYHCLVTILAGQVETLLSGHTQGSNHFSTTKSLT
jgi:hypothetical protein